MIANKKQYITIWAEENGSISSGNLEWSFGNGTESQSKYGYCIPVSGKIIYATLTATAGGSTTSDIFLTLIINGVENTYYIIRKPANKLSYVTLFKKPFNLNAGDVINFKSKTNNPSVTHALVSLLIEIDV